MVTGLVDFLVSRLDRTETATAVSDARIVVIPPRIAGIGILGQGRRTKQLLRKVTSPVLVTPSGIKVEAADAAPMWMRRHLMSMCSAADGHPIKDKAV